MLTELQERAHDAGIELDVGSLPDTGNVVQGDSSDPEQLAKVIQRIVARIGDRFAFVRKIARHFEGTDKRAGILSDVVSATWILYQRNPAAGEQFIRHYARQLRAQAAERKATAKTKTPPSQSNHNGGKP